jgi:hypothetical protein
MVCRGVPEIPGDAVGKVDVVWSVHGPAPASHCWPLTRLPNYIISIQPLAFPAGRGAPAPTRTRGTQRVAGRRLWGREGGRETALHGTMWRIPIFHCTALHCTALHCTALHCTALHCTALHCTSFIPFGKSSLTSNTQLCLQP